jgi:1-phosphofructokinase family hexose kinase
MLLALTTNPSIDRTLVVPGFRAGDVTRVQQRHDAAGGKGLNVARVLQRLGGAVLACAPLGGEIGKQIAALASQEGIPAAWYWMQHGESRICLLISDPATRDTLVINEQGPQMSLADWQGFAALVKQQSAQVRAISFSGSLMPGVPIDSYTTLVRELITLGQQVYVDISNDPLRATLDLPIALLKVNAHELGVALGRPLTNRADCVAAAQAVLLRPNGPRSVVVTLGSDGAIGCDSSGAWHVVSPAIQLVSAVGSGDSLLAGLAHGLLQDAALPEALRLGVAAGAANAQTLGGGNVDLAEVQRLTKASIIAAL